MWCKKMLKHIVWSQYTKYVCVWSWPVDCMIKLSHIFLMQHRFSFLFISVILLYYITLCDIIIIDILQSNVCIISLMGLKDILYTFYQRNTHLSWIRSLLLSYNRCGWIIDWRFFPRYIYLLACFCFSRKLIGNWWANIYFRHINVMQLQKCCLWLNIFINDVNHWLILLWV